MTKDNKTAWDKFLDEHPIYKTGYVIDEIDVADAFEAGRNDVINEACEWLENNLDGYLVIKEDNYEGCVKACYIHSNVYRDFEESMKGDRDND